MKWTNGSAGTKMHKIVVTENNLTLSKTSVFKVLAVTLF